MSDEIALACAEILRRVGLLRYARGDAADGVLLQAGSVSSLEWESACRTRNADWSAADCLLRGSEDLQDRYGPDGMSTRDALARMARALVKAEQDLAEALNERDRAIAEVERLRRIGPSVLLLRPAAPGRI